MFFFFSKDLASRTPNVKTFMNELNFHFHQYVSNKTDINLNENATAH